MHEVTSCPHFLSFFNLKIHTIAMHILHLGIATYWFSLLSYLGIKKYKVTD